MNHEFKITINETDFMAFYKNYIYRSILSTRNIILYSIFLLFLLVMPIVTNNLQYLMYFGIFMVAIVLLFFMVRRQGKRLYNNNPDAFNMTFTLTEKDITFQTDEGKSTKFWSEFFSVVEEENYYFLYLKNKRGLIFVKNQMTDEQRAFLVTNATATMKEKNIGLQQK